MNSTRPRDMCLRKYQRRNMTVNLDLSIGLPGQTTDQVGSSSAVVEQNVQPVRQQNAPVPIDVDAIDDEVLLSSARAFAEAKNKSRRVHVTRELVDLDSGEQATRFTNCYKRRRNSSKRPVNVDHVYVNLETSCNLKKDKVTEKPKIVPPPPPPPPEPAFSCPICMGELVEEMTTKCGHIFCKKCILTAISKKSICPTCRKKVNKKDVIRIYLPATR